MAARGQESHWGTTPPVLQQQLGFSSDITLLVISLRALLQPRRHFLLDTDFHSFPFRHWLPLLMVLAARKIRARRTLKPKEKLSLRAEQPLQIHSRVCFGHITATQSPLKAMRCQLWVAAELGRSRQAEEQWPSPQSSLGAAGWGSRALCPAHTCQGSEGWAKPSLPGQGKWELGSKSLVSDYRNGSTKVRVPKVVGFNVFYCCSFLSLDHDKWAGLLMGFPCQGPLTPILSIFPHHLLRFNLRPASSLEILNGP